MKAIAIATLSGLLLSPLVTPAVEPAVTAADEAEDMLRRVVAAYQSAPALEDEIVMRIDQETGDQGERMVVRFSGENTAQVVLDGMKMTAIDEKFIIERDSIDTRYFATEMDKNLLGAIRDVFGPDARFPFPHLSLRYGDDMTEYLAGFGLGFPVNLRPMQVEQEQWNERTVQTLRLEDGGSWFRVRIDPETHLIHQMTFSLGPAGIPDEHRLNGSVSMKPKASEELERPITFAAGERRRLDDFMELRLQVGDKAPDFELPGTDGQKVKLSDLRGQVVLLDFWATWCQPCIAGLPKVDEFAKWAMEHDYPVLVYAVNVMEQMDTEERMEAVKQFWESRNLRFKTLIDTENVIPRHFEIEAIPTYITVGRDGRIVDIHVGGASVEHFQKVTRDALGDVEQPSD